MSDRSWLRARWMPLFCLLVGRSTLGAQSAIPNPFHLVPLAEGVYASIQDDPIGVAIDGNSAVIINDRDVVVVDTHNAPANAEALVREIRRLTPKPVRYVINTHWHGDHHHGNEVFRRAYPGVEFIAHTNTALDLAAQGNDSTLRYATDVTFPA